MPSLLDHALAAALVLVLPLYVTLTWPGRRRRLRQDPSRWRVREYARVILVQWTLAAATLALWLSHDRPLELLGLGLPVGWGLGVATGVAIAVLGFLALQLRAVRGSEKLQERVRQQIANVKDILPHSRRELRWFIAVSVTAGVCEELLYRGWLIWYFDAWLPRPAALALAVMVFGLAHAYQGRHGIWKTGIAGLVAAGLYELSGSLWIPMLLHAALDMNGGQMALAAMERECGVVSR
jgi:membrane protease YdiL (CAAX protease family)